MKIELTKIKVSELFDGFVDNNEEGVRKTILICIIP